MRASGRRVGGEGDGRWPDDDSDRRDRRRRPTSASGGRQPTPRADDSRATSRTVASADPDERPEPDARPSAGSDAGPSAPARSPGRRLDRRRRVHSAVDGDGGSASSASSAVASSPSLGASAVRRPPAHAGSRSPSSRRPGQADADDGEAEQPERSSTRASSRSAARRAFDGRDDDHLVRRDPVRAVGAGHLQFGKYDVLHEHRLADLVDVEGDRRRRSSDVGHLGRCGTGTAFGVRSVADRRAASRSGRDAGSTSHCVGSRNQSIAGVAHEWMPVRATFVPTSAGSVVERPGEVDARRPRRPPTGAWLDRSTSPWTGRGRPRSARGLARPRRSAVGRGTPCSSCTPSICRWSMPASRSKPS